MRDRGGYDHPVDWPVGSLALSGMAYDTPEARDAAQFYVLLGSEGLLLRRPGAYDDDFQPIAETILVVNSPGAHVTDPVDLPYRHLRPGIRLRPLGPVHRA